MLIVTATLKGVLTLAVPTVAVVVLLVFWSGRFCWNSVCGRCGTEKWTQEWQVPHTSLRLFTHSKEFDTPLSITLRTNGLVRLHRHDWRFVHGSGNGVRCALGEGESLWQTAVHPQTLQLIEALHRYHESAFRDKVLANVLDPRSSWAASIAFSVPDECLANATSLHDWIRDNSAEVDQVLQDLRDK